MWNWYSLLCEHEGSILLLPIFSYLPCLVNPTIPTKRDHQNGMLIFVLNLVVLRRTIKAPKW